MKNNKKISNPQQDQTANEGNTPPLTNEKGMQAITELLGTYQGSPFDATFSERVVQAIKQNQSPAHHNAPVFRLHPTAILKMAAVIALLVAVGFFFWNAPRTYNAPLGTMSNVTFPDGSTVLLNSGSSITYRPFVGKSTRAVQLHGEGFFDIVTSEKPFVVETFNTNIQVLGTRFSVTSWPNTLSQQTSVTLEEGKIRVNPSDSPEKATEMLPQQTLVVYANSTVSNVEQLSDNKTQNVLSWRTGGYAFQNMPLGAITQELQRRGNLMITVPDQLLDTPITYFEPDAVPVEDVLEDLSQAYSFSYSKTANGFAVTLPTSN